MSVWKVFPETRSDEKCFRCGQPIVLYRKAYRSKSERLSMNPRHGVFNGYVRGEETHKCIGLDKLGSRTPRIRGAVLKGWTVK